MDEALRREIIESLKRGESAISIFDRLSVNYDPYEIRKEIMSSYNKKMIINPYDLNANIHVPPKPKKNIDLKIPNMGKKLNLSKKSFKILIGLLIFGIILIVLSMIKVTVNTSDSGLLIPKDSFHGQVDFSSIDTNEIQDLFPDISISSEQKVYQKDTYTMHEITFFIGDGNQFVVEVYDYLSKDLADNNFDNLYEEYSSKYKIVSKYDQANLYKALFEIDSDLNYKNLYMTSEQNFFYKGRGEFVNNKEKEGNNKNTFYVVNRVRAISHKVIR